MNGILLFTMCLLLYLVLILGAEGCNVGGADMIDYLASGIICFCLFLILLYVDIIQEAKDKRRKKRIESGLPGDTT